MEDFKQFNQQFSSDEEHVYNPELVNNIIKKIDLVFNKENDNFAELCFLFHKLSKLFENTFMIVNKPGVLEEDVWKLNHLHKGRAVMPEKLQYAKYWDFKRVYESYGFNKKTIERMLRVFDRFVEMDIKNAGVPKIKKEFSGFSRSKLFELLPVSDSQIIEDLKNEKIKDSMTKLEIRAYVKSLKDGAPGADKVLEESNSEFKEEFVQEEKDKTNYLVHFEPKLFNDVLKYLRENLDIEPKQDIHDFVNEAVKLHLENLKTRN